MKVLFFDIDGTINNFDGEIPDSAIAGIRRAREKGNIVALCSGRSESQISSEILDIGFDAIVSAAGARVSLHGEEIYEQTITPEKYHFLLDQLLEPIPNLCVQTNECVYLEEDAAPIMYEKLKQISPDDRDPNDMIGNMKKIPSVRGIHKVQKLFYHMAPLTVDEVQEKLGEYFQVTELSFGFPTPYCGEITIRGVEKSTGMEQLMRHFGLTASDAVAFGDGPNDLDMMEYAGLSICMGNGREETKRRADYVTADVMEDGLYKAMEHFELI
ncbi:MAG: Cof-type HAD-IIB family hydrolase [Lachnospiraceae bacterium]|nr:Cof-type HAD-IIB family hydrolase [Lachnospiraceae bacterium]